jgi:GDPmannose 4,6-dehydratase
VNYREAYGMFACNGILFNHESPVRGETFVTRKITRALARIAIGLQDCLYIGNLNAKRDWGHAKDFVRAQWLMLQLPAPEDFVIATGIQRSVRDFVNAVAAEYGIQLDWQGRGKDETARVAKSSNKRFSELKNGQTVVRVDPHYFRPSEVDSLLGDASKAKAKLGWKPEIGFKDLVAEMAREDLALAERDLLARDHGHKTFDYRDERA